MVSWQTEVKVTSQSDKYSELTQIIFRHDTEICTASWSWIQGKYSYNFERKKIGENPFNMFNIDKRMMKWVSHKKKMMDARADFKSYSNYLLARILIIIFVSILFQLNNWMENNKTEDNFSWPATSSPMLTLVTADPTGDETNN